MMARAGQERLLLGVDGGGSKTDAVLASLDAHDRLKTLGRGQSGPSNLRLAGRDLALSSLDHAIRSALADGGREGARVQWAVLALAGCNHVEVRQEVERWAEQSGHFEHAEIIHDAQPVLAAGTPEGQGIALVVGTGSVATGLDRRGRAWTCGGWGHWFGDRGSGFDVGRGALAVASAVDDGMAGQTGLHQRVLEHFGIDRLRDVMQVLARSADVRARIAAVAPVVFAAAAAGDLAARRILERGADHLAALVAGVAQALEFEEGFPLALAGSMVCRQPLYHELLLQRLAALAPSPGPVQMVPEPVLGCMEIARSRLVANMNDESPE